MYSCRGKLIHFWPISVTASWDTRNIALAKENAVNKRGWLKKNLAWHITNALKYAFHVLKDEYVILFRNCISHNTFPLGCRGLLNLTLCAELTAPPRIFFTSRHCLKVFLMIQFLMSSVSWVEYRGVYSPWESERWRRKLVSSMTAGFMDVVVSTLVKTVEWEGGGFFFLRFSVSVTEKSVTLYVLFLKNSF